jgi:hypothetical protein
MGVAIPLCKTMWSLNRAEGFTSANATTAKNRKRQHAAAAKRFCMGPLVLKQE